MFESLIALLNSKYKRWSFTGSIVDWHYFDGQVVIKDIDVITSDYGELDFDQSMRAERDQFRWRGKVVEVFRGTPSEGMFETPEERIEKLELVAKVFPYRAEKCRRVIERYRGGSGAVVGTSGKRRRETSPTTCPHRGPQLRTITSAICLKKTIDLPVYACGLYGGECVHRQVCSNHDPAIRICVGCPGRA
jgi:hypothetical protein